MLSAQTFKAKKQVMSSLGFELNFINIAVFSQMGKLVLFNYGLCTYGGPFLEKFKKRPTLKLEELRNGQHLEICNF